MVRNAPAASNPMQHRAEEWGRKFGQTTVGKITGVVLLGGLSFGFFTLFLPGSSPEEAVARSAAKEAAMAQRASEKAEEQTKGFHCLSAWDGSHDGIVRFTKEKLRDPSSFEHVRTEIAPNDKGVHSIRMQFRVKNGFGGMSVGMAVGEIHNNGCGLIQARIVSS